MEIGKENLPDKNMKQARKLGFFAKIKNLVFPQKLLIFLTRAIFCRQEFPGKTLLDHQLSLFIPYSKHLRRIWLTSTEEEGEDLFPPIFTSSLFLPLPPPLSPTLRPER